LAGIPPTAGFVGKLYIFKSAVEAGMTWLAALALIFAAISAYFYLRLVMVMYMREPSDHSETAPHMVMSPTLSIVLACTVAGVVIFGVYPNPLINFAMQAVSTLK
ncbi:MAG: NADH-quinone oxidoreductase subunit L, partial [Nitrospira sp.]|nr:NADH-quinone oxidoreductase subunit L [Nitrospira sp.]